MVAKITALVVALFFIVASVLLESGTAPAGSAVLGALLGFLLYNAYPAKVFMGDTGSLALGGFVAGMAYMMQMPLFILIVGIIYLCEIVSVMMQVTYFKATHGKRIFKMAPFHHHLEMGGWTGKKWTEKELFALYTCVSVIFAVISFFGVRGRF